MILFTILLVVLAVIAAIVLAVIGVIGGATAVIFGDIIVFALIVVLIVKFFKWMKKRK